MRKILFRGKESGNNKWVYGFYSKHDGETYIEDETKKHSVYSDTVGQYTGLQDMNGEKIFEGDIVKYNSIVCPEDTTTGKVEMYHGSWELLDGIGIISIGQCFPKMLKIIGNIYDNPELHI